MSRRALVNALVHLLLVSIIALCGCGTSTEPEPTSAVETPANGDPEAAPDGRKTEAELITEVRTYLARHRSIDPDDEFLTGVMHDAAYHGYVKLAELLLETGISTYWFDGEHEIPIHFLPIAAGQGHIKIVKLLIAKGAELDVDPYHGTPLLVALYHGHNDVARLLIAAGADVNASSLRTGAPLHVAAVGGDLAMVKLLLSKGADPNQVGEEVGSPVGEAISRSRSLRGVQTADWPKRLAAINALIEGGAKPGLCQTAALGRIDDVRRLLDEGASLAQMREPPLPTALHWAVYFGHADVAELVIDRGVDIDAEDWHDLTALQAAVRENDVPMARLLIRKGARIGLKTYEGRTALEMAIELKHPEMEKLLRSKGARLDIFGAATLGRIDLVKAFLKNPELAHATDEEGCTALHFAAEHGRTEIARLLIAAGADVDAKDDMGRTPLDVANIRRHEGVVALLRRPRGGG